jgi:hypothetical protein
VVVHLRIPNLCSVFSIVSRHNPEAGHAVVAGQDIRFASEMPCAGAVLWDIALAVGEPFLRPLRVLEPRIIRVFFCGRRCDARVMDRLGGDFQR